MQNTTLFDTNSNEVVPNKELVKITQAKFGVDEVNAVNARDLHKALDSKKDFSSWIKARIEKLGLVESRDYGVFTQMGENLLGGRPAKEYIVTIDIAKHLAMIEMTDKGHQVREYFIECEKKLKKHYLPQTYAEALMELALAEKEKERLALENQTKQKTIDLLTHTNKTYTITEIAKELNMSSAIRLNRKLAELKVQYQVNGTWVMYSKYSDMGYEIIKQEVLDSGQVIYHRRITQMGREFILNLIQGAENESN